jgi:hypothetical protein
MRLLILITLLFPLVFGQCESFDNRLKIINVSGREKILSCCIVGNQDYDKNFGTLTCEELDSASSERITYDSDTVKWMLHGIHAWESLEKKDTAVIYVFDKLRFERHCKGELPYDSCYVRYAFTKDDLIKLNWTIRIVK